MANVFGDPFSLATIGIAFVSERSIAARRARDSYTDNMVERLANQLRELDRGQPRLDLS